MLKESPAADICQFAQTSQNQNCSRSLPQLVDFLYCFIFLSHLFIFSLFSFNIMLVLLPSAFSPTWLSVFTNKLYWASNSFIHGYLFLKWFIYFVLLFTLNFLVLNRTTCQKAFVKAVFQNALQPSSFQDINRLNCMQVSKCPHLSNSFLLPKSCVAPSSIHVSRPCGCNMFYILFAPAEDLRVPKPAVSARVHVSCMKQNVTLQKMSWPDSSDFFWSSCENPTGLQVYRSFAVMSSFLLFEEGGVGGWCREGMFLRQKPEFTFRLRPV